MSAMSDSESDTLFPGKLARLLRLATLNAFQSVENADT